MTTATILAQLSAYGNEQTRNTFLRHGGPENMFGVKVQDLKKIQKQVKKNHALALELYATGNSDAMYLAGLIADEKQMTPEQLQSWAEAANWSMISDYTVPWVAAESGHGLELALRWINDPRPNVACAGWNTLSGLVALQPDTHLDLPLLESLLERVTANLHQSPDRVRYTMNNFVIATGSYVIPLNARAKQVAAALGKVTVDMGNTACKVPDALLYIEKVEKAGKLGKKWKTVRC